MTTVRRTLLAALAMGMVTFPGPFALAEPDDEIQVCRDENGRIVALQGDPCPELTPPAPKPVAQPRATPAPRPPVRTPQPAWRIVPRTPQRPSPARPGLARQSFPITVNGETTPAFSTPEQTWRSFLAATASGDPAAAAGCFTPAALRRLGPVLPLAELRALVASFTRIENEGSVGPFWSIYGVRKDARPKWILFEEDEAGEWKIAGM